MNALLFALHGAFVLVELIVCHIIEWILGVRCLVDCCIMLEATLYDSLGSSTHEHHMVASLRDSCIFDAICLIPGNALQYVRLWTGRDFISTSIILDLSKVNKKVLVALDTISISFL